MTKPTRQIIAPKKPPTKKVNTVYDRTRVVRVCDNSYIKKQELADFYEKTICLFPGLARKCEVPMPLKVIGKNAGCVE